MIAATMITRSEFRKAQMRAARMLREAGIALKREERDRIEVADFGLSQLQTFGLEIVTYVNTERCCAKELVLFPFQICPEHSHPNIDSEPGKEETFRCRKGLVHLYVSGPKTERPHARIPRVKESYFNAWHEITLKPGEQYTLPPNTLHWFQAGKTGAIVSEFSTRSIDERDIFTDPEIKRTTVVV